MPKSEPDWTEVFDEDYLRFHESCTDNARTTAEAETLWRVLALQPDQHVLDLACGTGRIARKLAERGCNVRSFAREVVTERGDDFMIDRNDYDPRTGRVHTQRTVVRASARRRFAFSVRLFGFPELRDWLMQAGFTRVDAFDGEGQALHWESPRMIVLAHK